MTMTMTKSRRMKGAFDWHVYTAENECRLHKPSMEIQQIVDNLPGASLFDDVRSLIDLEAETWKLQWRNAHVHQVSVSI